MCVICIGKINSFLYMCFVCGLWSLRHGRRVVVDGGARLHTFQLGGDAIGNALLARDLDCCQHAFASGAQPRLLQGCLQRHTPDPSWKSVGDTPILRSSDTKMTPPPFQNPGYGPVNYWDNNGRAPMTSAWLWPYLYCSNRF